MFHMHLINPSIICRVRVGGGGDGEVQARDHASRQRFTICKGETDVVIDIVNEGPRDAKRPPFDVARDHCLR